MSVGVLEQDRFALVAPTVQAATEWAGDGPDRLALVSVTPPGSGKTTQVLVQQIERAAQSGRGVALLMPSHPLAAEKTAQAKKIAARLDVADRVVHVRGQRDLCPHGRGLNAARAKGYVGYGRKLHQLACGFDGCDYSSHIEGIGHKHIKIATHAHLDFLLDTGRLDGNVVVVDEVGALLDDISLEPQDFWLAADGPAFEHFSDWLTPLRPAAAVVARAVQMRELAAFRQPEADTPPFVVREPIGQQADLLVSAAGFDGDDLIRIFETAAQVSPGSAPNPPRRTLQENDLSRVPRADLPLFFATVAAELRGSSGPDNRSVACFCTRGCGAEAKTWIEWRVVRRLPEGISIVMLDATADMTEPVLRRAIDNKDIRVFSHAVPMPGPADGLHAYHVRHNSLTRRRLFTRRGGKDILTPRGAASARNVLREAERLAGRHLPAAPETAITAPSPLTRALEDPGDLLGRFRELAQEAGHLGGIKTAYHWGLRGLNTLEDATLFINLGDPVKNLGAVREEARLFGLDPDDHAARTAAAELIQTLHRSRALRVTPDRPKVAIHAGRYPMVGFTAETIELGPGPRRTHVRLALEDLALLLLEHGQATAPWLLDAVLAQIERWRTEQGARLAGPAAVVTRTPVDPRHRRRIWQELLSSVPGVEAHLIKPPGRPLGTRGGPVRVYTRGGDVLDRLQADLDGWAAEVANAIFPACCADARGLPISRSTDKIPSGSSRGDLVRGWTEEQFGFMQTLRLWMGMSCG